MQLIPNMEVSITNLPLTNPTRIQLMARTHTHTHTHTLDNADKRQNFLGWSRIP